MDERTMIRVLKALAHPRRFRMVEESARAGELSCGQVGGCFEVAQPTISHHVKILADAGVIAIRREAQCALISVDTQLVSDALSMLKSRVLLQATPRRTRRVKKVARAR